MIEGLVGKGKRMAVIRKYHGICVYCGDQATTVDHLVPRSYKIDNSDDNLVACCGLCNCLAGNKLFSSFQEKKAFILKRRQDRRIRARVLALSLGDVLYNPSEEVMLTAKPQKQPRQPKQKKGREPRMDKVTIKQTDYMPAFDMLLEILQPSLEGMGKVEVYEELARRLSAVANKKPEWGWRYVQGVRTGTIEPSPKMVRAIEVLAASMDGMPVEISNAERVSVYAQPGTIRSGSLILASSRMCKSPVCKVSFVPRTPNQVFHNPRCQKIYARIQRLDAWYKAHPDVKRRSDWMRDAIY